MPNNPKLEAFLAALSREDSKEVDRAVALIWFVTHGIRAQENVTAGEIAAIFHEHRLTGPVNISRLNTNLGKHADVVKGKRQTSFCIKAASDHKLSDKYKGFADLSALPVGDSVISNSISLGERKILDELRKQINGSYDRGFYIATAVLLRRLTEILLIQTFEKSGHLDDIRDSAGEIVMFAELILRAKSKNFVKLSRTAPAALDKIKDIGDTAAHHRYYVVLQRDIDNLNPATSRLIAELAALSGFH